MNNVVQRCPYCGKDAVTLESGNVLPQCENCGWIPDNVIPLTLPQSSEDDVFDVSEKYTIYVHEFTEHTFATLVTPNGKVIAQFIEETRHAALQKLFFMLVLKRKMQ